MSALIAVVAVFVGAPLVAGVVAARRQPLGPDLSETTCWRTAWAFADAIVAVVALAVLIT